MARAANTFYGPLTLTAAAATLATSPAASGGSWVIRHIHFANTDSSARTVNFSIGADAANTRIVAGYSIPANSTLDVYGVFVVPASTIIQGFASVTAVVNITVSGTLETVG